FALQVGLYRFEPLTDVGVGPSLHEGNRPIVDITAQKMDILPALRPDKIVGDGFVVVQEVVLDGVALVSEAENEVRMSEVSVVLHQVQENRPRPNLHHGFGDTVDVASKPHTGSAAKEDHFHNLPPCFPPQ